MYIISYVVCYLTPNLALRTLATIAYAIVAMVATTIHQHPPLPDMCFLCEVLVLQHSVLAFRFVPLSCATSGSQSSPTISSNQMVVGLLLIARILDWEVRAIFLGLGLL